MNARNRRSALRDPVRPVVVVALTLNAVAAAVSIDRGMPADWAGLLNGDPDNVLADWLGWRGTAIAPPLAMMVLLGVAAFASRRRGMALWLLMLLGLGGVVGYLGEPATWELAWTTTPFAWSGIALYLTIAVLAFVAVSRKVPSSSAAILGSKETAVIRS